MLCSEKSRAEVVMVQNLSISQIFWNTRLCYLIPLNILLALPEMQYVNKPHQLGNRFLTELRKIIQGWFFFVCLFFNRAIEAETSRHFPKANEVLIEKYENIIHHYGDKSHERRFQKALALFASSTQYLSVLSL